MGPGFAGFADLTDATLADEDTNSTQYMVAKFAIYASSATKLQLMQVSLPGGQISNYQMQKVPTGGQIWNL